MLLEKVTMHMRTSETLRSRKGYVERMPETIISASSLLISFGPDESNVCTYLGRESSWAMTWNTLPH